VWYSSIICVLALTLKLFFVGMLIAEREKAIVNDEYKHTFYKKYNTCTLFSHHFIIDGFSVVCPLSHVTTYGKIPPWQEKSQKKKF